MSAYHGLNNTRLEVAIPTPALGNLLDNPSGALGAWSWLTPINDSGMHVGNSGGPYLEFQNVLTSKAAYFTSDYLPVVAGKWVGARFDTISATASHNVKVRFEWYDASKNLLSSSVQSSAFSGTAQTNIVTPIVAPASTAYVKARFDFYNGSGNPSALGFYRFRNAMVAWANGSTFLGVRTNLITNPSVETNATGWDPSSQGSAGTLARTNTVASVGSWCLSYTADATGKSVSLAAVSPYITSIAGGQDYTWSFRARAATTGRTVEAEIIWLDSSSNTISRQMVAGTDATGSFSTTSVTSTAPTNATKALVTFRVRGSNGGTLPASEVHYFDAFLFEQASTAQTYFDGATVLAGHTFAWSGTANASTSTDTIAYPFVDGPTYQNILGPTHTITVNREAMNLGTLVAEVLDAALDPADAASILVVGARVRLRALVSGTWETVFSGRINDPSSVYIRAKNPGAKTKTIITFAAVDAMLPLTQPETRVSGSSTDAPHIIETTGVPWNINGDGNQRDSAVAWSTWNGSTVIDILSVLRDSNNAYCWVDRNGVLQFWEPAYLSGTLAATFSDASGAPLSYSSIDVGWNRQSCINYIDVTWQRIGPGPLLELEDVEYGPYVDQTSINKWGVCSAEFTLSDSVVVSETSIATWAAAVLAANATPTRRANGLVMPVRNAAELGYAATLDLYSKVRVTFDTKITNQDQRIVGIQHTITTDAWDVEYTFDAPGLVATPSVSPSASAGSSSDGQWQTPTLSGTWANFGGSERNVQYIKKNGVVYVVGTAKSGTIGTQLFVLPSGYRPANIERFPVVSNGAFGQAIVNSAGVVTANNGNNTFFALNFSFPAEG